MSATEHRGHANILAKVHEKTRDVWRVKTPSQLEAVLDPNTPTLVFDRVLDASVTRKALYRDTIRPVVASVLQGTSFSVVIADLVGESLLVGDTVGEHRGVLSRSIQDIFYYFQKKATSSADLSLDLHVRVIPEQSSGEDIRTRLTSPNDVVDAISAWRAILKSPLESLPFAVDLTVHQPDLGDTTLRFMHLPSGSEYLTAHLSERVIQTTDALLVLLPSRDVPSSLRMFHSLTQLGQMLQGSFRQEPPLQSADRWDRDMTFNEMAEAKAEQEIESDYWRRQHALAERSVVGLRVSEAAERDVWRAKVEQLEREKEQMRTVLLKCTETYDRFVRANGNASVRERALNEQLLTQQAAYQAMQELMSKNIAGLEEDKLVLVAQVSQLKAEVYNQIQSGSALQNDFATLRNELEAVSRTCEHYRGTADDKTRESLQLNEIVTRLEMQLEDLNVNHVAAYNENDSRHREKIQSLENQLRDGDKQINTLTDRIQALTRDLAEARMKSDASAEHEVQRSRNQIQVLTSEVESLRLTDVRVTTQLTERENRYAERIANAERTIREREDAIASLRLELEDLAIRLQAALQGHEESRNAIETLRMHNNELQLEIQQQRQQSDEADTQSRAVGGEMEACRAELRRALRETDELKEMLDTMSRKLVRTTDALSGVSDENIQLSKKLRKAKGKLDKGGPRQSGRSGGDNEPRPDNTRELREVKDLYERANAAKEAATRKLADREEQFATLKEEKLAVVAESNGIRRELQIALKDRETTSQQLQKAIEQIQDTRQAQRLVKEEAEKLERDGKKAVSLLEGERGVLEQQLTKLRSQCDILTASLAEKSNQNASAAEALQTCKAELRDALRSRDDIQKRVDDVSQQLKVKEEQAATLGQSFNVKLVENSRLKEGVETLTKSVQESESRCLSLQRELEASRFKEDSVRKQLDEATTALAATKNDVKLKSSQLNESEREVEKLTVALGKASVQIDALQEKLAAARAEIADGTARLNDLKKDFDAATRDLVKTTRDRDTLLETIKANGNEMKSLEGALKAKTAELQESSNRLSEVNQRLAQLTADSDALRVTLQKLQASEAQWKERTAAAQVQIGTLEEERGRREQEIVQLKSVKQVQESNLSALTQQLSSTQDALKRLQGVEHELHASRLAEATLASEKTRLIADVERIQRECDQTRQSLQQSQGENQKLNRDNDDLQSALKRKSETLQTCEGALETEVKRGAELKLASQASADAWSSERQSLSQQLRAVQDELKETNLMLERGKLELSRLTAVCDQREKDLVDLRAEQSRLGKQLGDSSNESMRLSLELSNSQQKLSSTEASLRKTTETLEQQSSEWQRGRLALEGQIEKLRGDIREKTIASDDLAITLNRVNKEREEDGKRFEAQMSQCQTQLAASQAEAGEIKTKLSGELSATVASLQTAQRAIDVAAAEKRALQAAHDQLAAKVEAADGVLRESEQQRVREAERTRQCDAMEKTVQLRDGEVLALKEELRRVNEDVLRLRESCNSAVLEHKLAEQKLEHAHEQLDRLAQDVDAMRRERIVLDDVAGSVAEQLYTSQQMTSASERDAADLRGLVQKMKRELELRALENMALQEQVSALEVERYDLGSDVARLRDDNASLLTEMRNVKSELVTAESVAKRHQLQAASAGALAAECENLQRLLEETQQTVANNQNLLSRHATQLALAEAERSAAEAEAAQCRADLEVSTRSALSLSHRNSRPV